MVAVSFKTGGEIKKDSYIMKLSRDHIIVDKTEATNSNIQNNEADGQNGGGGKEIRVLSTNKPSGDAEAEGFL